MNRKVLGILGNEELELEFRELRIKEGLEYIEDLAEKNPGNFSGGRGLSSKDGIVEYILTRKLPYKDKAIPRIPRDEIENVAAEILLNIDAKSVYYTTVFYLSTRERRKFRKTMAWVKTHYGDEVRYRCCMKPTLLYLTNTIEKETFGEMILECP